MTDRLEIVQGHELSPDFEAEWAALFARCYRTNEEKGRILLRKYKLNKSLFCVLYVDGVMAASYSGLIASFADTEVFLSTDTMSSGMRRGASIVMGEHLYKHLTQRGILAVCGYPNEKIRKLRQERLKWTLKGTLFLWVGIPLLWRIGRHRPSKNLWKIERPAGGYFGHNIPGLTLVRRDIPVNVSLGFSLALSSCRPGPFFIRVPTFLFAPRTFGYRFLSGTNDQQSAFIKCIAELDLETIDLP